MPNHPLAGAIIVVSVAVAAAIAVYESPQARRLAQDLRTKIALALHALGDEIGPNSVDPNGQPRFNRPEDAEGFIRSQGALAEPGVDADEDSKRRQREELMYWNAVRMQNLGKNGKGKEQEERPTRSRGSSFEDFLQEEHGAEKGSTYVLQSTGTDRQDEGLRQRGVRGLERGTAWANPFDDEHHIESSQESGIIANDVGEKYEILSEGLYSASDSPQAAAGRGTIDELIDVSDPPISLPDADDHSAWMQERTRNIPIQSPSVDAEAAFASIHAWAEQSNTSFYSPLPTTPRALSPVPSQPLQLSIPSFTGDEEFSDPPESVQGDLTPTDSMSVVDGTDEIWGLRSGATSETGVGRGMDVLSIADSDFEGDAEGAHTPSTWSEVASVVSEGDLVGH